MATRMIANRAADDTADWSDGIAANTRQRRRRGRWARLLRRDFPAVLGAVFIVVVIVGAIFAPWLTSYSATAPVIADRLQTPSLVHPFGTDEFGRDLLARILWGARSVLYASGLSIVVATVLGAAVGTAAGFWGGRADQLLMRLMDIMLSFPAILLAILIVASLGAGLTNAVIAISFSMLPLFARLVRSVVLTLVQEDYVLAAHALGSSSIHIIRRHILRGLVAPLVVQATVMLAVAINTAAALNFLGLGVKSPQPDWGLMVSEGQRLVFDAPHVPIVPGIALALLVLSVNFIGDALRDALDPRTRNV